MAFPEIRDTLDFFFYGTLCHPAILLRVLRRETEGLKFHDAVLPGYTRHHVKNEDYPAVIDKQSATELLSENGGLHGDINFTTRGTLVKGLSYGDVLALDTFEGNQYTRHELPVRVAQQHSGASPALFRADATVVMASSSTESAAEDSDGEGNEVIAWVYVWNDDVNLLEPKIWDFQTFVQDKADVWTGTSTTEYDDVERHHALREEPNSLAVTEGGWDASVKGAKSGEVELDGQRLEGFPDFGHGMLKYWSFKQGYLNFNNGSYGSPPTSVVRAMRAISDECEACPDHFIKRAYLPHLHKARQRVADLIGAGMDEVVIVPGATHGMNNILREMDWAEGDIILAYNTTYGAVAQTIKYLCDRDPTLTLEVINLDFPVSHAEIVRRTEEVLERFNTPARPHYTGQAKPMGVDVHRRIRGLVIDQISSMPGMVYPMDDLIRLCKKYGVLSMVDAAHAIGQVKTDVKASDPDFWVSWLYAHRACAVLYVPIRNQGLIRSTLPTGYGYESERYPTPGVNRQREFASQYDYVSTQDWGPFFSINSALDFRQMIGGEDRILTYCHALAVAGGKRLTERWASVVDKDVRIVMESEGGELTAAMLNVFLPNAPVPKDVQETFEQRKYIEDKLFDANAFCAVYLHAGKVCARFSCQVWTQVSVSEIQSLKQQLDDFDRIAGILEDALAGIRQGKHTKVQVDAEETLHRAEDLPVQDE